MNKLVLFFILLTLSQGCMGQKKLKKDQKQGVAVPAQSKSFEPNMNELVGFGCFEGGIESNKVNSFSEFLKKKEFTTIRSKLFSISSAEKYLATIVCERLEQKELIKLTEEEAKQIRLNRESKELVSICSGCTNWNELTIQELVESDKNFLKERAEIWLNDLIN